MGVENSVDMLDSWTNRHPVAFSDTPWLSVYLSSPP